MQIRSKLISIWRGVFRKPQLEAELNDEIRAYIDEQIRRKTRAGMTLETARREVHMELGSMDQLKEACRDVRRMRWTDSLLQDVRYALRTLRRNPGVTAIALVSLALGIGANTLVFSFMNALLFRPLPYPAPNRVVLVRSVSRAGDPQRSSLTRGNCADLRQATEIFDAFGCFTGDVWSSIADDGAGATLPESLPGQRFTAGLPRALGVQPLVGRWFTDAEDQENAEPVIVISYGLWQRRFGGASDAIGKSLRVDGERATVIGVMPADFDFIDSAAEYWLPLRSPAVGLRSPARILGGIARLKSELGFPRAQSMLEALALRLEEASPELNKGWSFVLQPMNQGQLAQEARSVAQTLGGAVAFVLLIACANVAGLLLAQGVTQHREFAVRAALGSGRGRLVRQSLVYSTLLSCAGGLLGLAAASGGLQIVRSVLPAGRIPRAVFATSIDGTVLGFAFVVSLACGLIAGIIPAMQVSHTEPLDVLRESTTNATASFTRQRLRSGFVVVQIALAFVLLVGAGLMMNSLWRAADSAPGFDPDQLATLEVRLPDAGFRRPANNILSSGSVEMRIDPQVQLTGERIRQNLAAIPGVTSATAIAIHAPLGGAMNVPIRVDQQTQERQWVQFIPIMPEYFSTLQARVIRGREFITQDSAGATPAAIINEPMARRYWPNENPVGQYVRIETPLLPAEGPRLIVGVVAEVAQYSGQQDRPQLYVPFSQLPANTDERFINDLRYLTFIVRSAQPVAQLAPALIGAVTAADSSQAVARIRTMRDTAYSKEIRRVYAGMVAAFAAIAVILAVVGIYGVMAQVVSQRTNEIGIRMALGAGAADVRRFVLRQGCVLIAAGLASGVAGAFAVTRVLRGSIPGVSPTDPLTFTAGLILLGAIALFACYIPALRASRVYPMLALRHE
jgi:putative ABC transport system permease protein